MALNLSTQVAVVARVDSALAAFSSGFPTRSEDRSSSCRLSSGGSVVCLQGPVLKSRVSSSVVPQESISMPLSSSCQPVQSASKQSQGSSTTLRNGVFINELVPGTEGTALIDIEDSGDGAVTFKYGALEDLWDLDRLLEYLCRGTYSFHTAESFVPLIVELFRFPVSSTGMRRMVDLLSSYVRVNRDVSPLEAEKMVSQILAEASSDYLPPPNLGTYRKGNLRPFKRFSSRTDKWWRKFDSYLGVSDASDFLDEDDYAGFDGFQMQSSRKYDSLNDRESFMPYKPAFSQTLYKYTPEFAWTEAPSQTSWSRPLLEYPKTSTLELVRESDFSSPETSEPSELVEGDYTAGLGFILISSQLNTLEDILRKTQLEEERNRESEILYAPDFSRAETLPTSSISAMMEWESHNACVSLPVNVRSKKAASVKVDPKKAKHRTSTKASQRVRGGKTSSTKSASKKRNSTERQQHQHQHQLCDMFFDLPFTHKQSGVAGFLVMRKDYSEEMLIVLNQVAVGLAGAGLAVTLHVGSRMLSVNSTFDSSKLFGLIRGAALLWLSAAMQSLRKVMLRLPPRCTIAGFHDKSELLCLQQRLKSLSFRALTVMVLTVVGHGF